MDGIHPSKCTILKIDSVFYSEKENNAVQSRNVSESHGILIHSQSNIFFDGLKNKFRTTKLYTKMLHFGFIFSGYVVKIHSKIHLRFPEDFQ